MVAILHGNSTNMSHDKQTQRTHTDKKSEVPAVLSVSDSSAQDLMMNRQKTIKTIGGQNYDIRQVYNQGAGGGTGGR
jgi:hypothetical protein